MHLIQWRRCNKTRLPQGSLACQIHTHTRKEREQRMQALRGRSHPACKRFRIQPRVWREHDRMSQSE